VSDRPPEPFRCDVEPDRGRVRVVPHGEIDVATVGELERRLRELRDSGFDQLVVDLRGVTFMDSTGLRLLLAWDDEARRNGIGFRLVAGSDPVQRLFELSGVASRFAFVDS
jgi:anti-sigma B factor antagonist